jgi:ribosome recycling factor
MIEQILTEINGKMQKAVEALTRDLATIRTGRASPALVEHIKADYHGILTPINQMASISIPDAKMILIQPWDSSSIKSIEKAILTSDLGLNPISDSRVMRIPIPPLKRLEDARIALRNLRREGIEKLRQSEKDKGISQDQCARASEQLQKLTDNFVDKINNIGQTKEKEIMEV